VSRSGWESRRRGRLLCPGRQGRFDLAFAGKLFGAFQRDNANATSPARHRVAIVQERPSRNGGRVWGEGGPADRGESLVHPAPRPAGSPDGPGPSNREGRPCLVVTTRGRPEHTKVISAGGDNQGRTSPWLSWAFRKRQIATPWSSPARCGGPWTPVRHRGPRRRERGGPAPGRAAGLKCRRSTAWRSCQRPGADAAQSG